MMVMSAIDLSLCYLSKTVSDTKTLCLRHKNALFQAQKQSVSGTKTERFYHKKQKWWVFFEMLLKAFAYFFWLSSLSTGSTLKSQAENHSGCEVSPVNSGSVETP